MSKFTYKVKNLFKTPEQREIEARVEFNRTKRSFTKYYKDLDGSIANFSRMAKEAELSGNHANALSCVRFVQKLQRTQTKVQGVIQRFEMMESMRQFSGTMSKFVEVCSHMGFNIDANINIPKMLRDSVGLESALAKMDSATDQMDVIFDTIDSAMSTGEETYTSNGEMQSEAEEMLNSIMGRENIIQYAGKEAARTGETAGEKDAAEADDDTEEILRRMLNDLKS